MKNKKIPLPPFNKGGNKKGGFKRGNRRQERKIL
jgi:hypothetical protein